mmetsp:Transcript_6915/g.20208  ORF Transcript_6915/g.20208 Transcript_6915/m.20208 type:complete len:153 (-) Transcript_6915:1918-2376(-)
MAQGWTRGMALTREVPRLATVGSFRRRRRGGEREDNPGRRGGGRQSVVGCACSTTGRGEGLPLELDLVRRSQEQGHAIGSVSPISFAFLGDVVWELYARTKHLLPPSRVASYRKETEREVMAEHQAACLDKLTGEGRLSEEEADIVRRGRNR